MKSVVEKILSIVIILEIVRIGASVEFDYQIKQKTKQCFGEALHENTIFVAKVNCTDPNFQLEANDPTGKDIVDKKRPSPTEGNSAEGEYYLDPIPISFTTYYTGNYFLCVENLNKDHYIRCTISIESGLEAKDYSELAKKKNVQPIEIQLKKMEDYMAHLAHLSKDLLASGEAKIEDIDSISSQLIIFTVITIALLTFLSYFQMAFLKRFFKQKKLI